MADSFPDLVPNCFWLKETLNHISATGAVRYTSTTIVMFFGDLQPQGNQLCKKRPVASRWPHWPCVSPCQRDLCNKLIGLFEKASRHMLPQQIDWIVWEEIKTHVATLHQKSPKDSKSIHHFVNMEGTFIGTIVCMTTVAVNLVEQKGRTFHWGTPYGSTMILPWLKGSVGRCTQAPGAAYARQAAVVGLHSDLGPGVGAYSPPKIPNFSGSMWGVP